MGVIWFFKKNVPKATVTFSTHEFTPEELCQQQEDTVNEIKQLARQSIPSANGLRPHEIFMLSYAPYYKTEGNSFPQFWHYDFGVDDPQTLLDVLLERGFIRIATAKESVEKLKIAELKKILSEHGINATGKKIDLVLSVREKISEEDLAQNISDRKYALTELGERELAENEYVTYFGGSMKYGLTVWDMNKMMQGYPMHLYRDKIWSHLNQQVYESTERLQKDGNIYAFYLRNISINYEMCDFLIEEKKNLKDALEVWARAFYYDLFVKSAADFKMTLDLEKRFSGPKEKRIRDPKTGESILVEDNSPPQFSDSLNLDSKSKAVQTVRDQLSFSDDQLFKSLISFFRECQPVQYDLMQDRNITKLILSHEDIAGLIIAETNGDRETADTVYRNIERQIDLGK